MEGRGRGGRSASNTIRERRLGSSIPVPIETLGAPNVYTGGLKNKMHH